MEDANPESALRPGLRATAESDLLREAFGVRLTPESPVSPFHAATPPRPPQFSRGESFGESLEGPLLKACGGRLSEVTWFRTDWQRGGAMTGYGRYKEPNNVWQPVVVKLPIPPQERYWLTRLQGAPDVVPRVYAHGDTIEGYDLAWIVMERMPHGPLGQAWGVAAFDLLAEAAARFYAAALEVQKPGQAPPEKDWEAVLKIAREQVAKANLPHAPRWKDALKKAQKKLRGWLDAWKQRPIDTICHGDLHPGNAMTRNPPPQGPAILLDLACVRAGSWVEDAVYFEHLFWARREKLEDRRICSMIAKARKTQGLDVDAGWPALASIRRALLALSTPAMPEHHSDPAHLEAALLVLEAEL